MRKKILHYYGERNGAYLHGSGEKATEFLLEELKLKDHDHVLELGFGTGATLVKIKSRHPLINLYGIDISELMLGRAEARLKFCGLKNVSLVATSTNNNIPFENNTFDKVYVESVLAIQDASGLRHSMSEIFRILKPGGLLLINESVWSNKMTPEEIVVINKKCELAFGIIQANADYAYPSQWVELLQQTGFSSAVTKSMGDIRTTRRLSMPMILSGLFTFAGHLKSFKPHMLKERRGYEKSIKEISPTDKNYLQLTFFKAIK